MFLRGSRYETNLGFDEPSDFQGVRPRDIGEATGVLEYTVKSGDRLDLLAQSFYNDGRLWWRILDANADILQGTQFNLDELEGEIILIPRFKE